MTTQILQSQSDRREDRLQIRDLIDNWAIWRDACMWEKFETCWNPEGRMMATWFQGTPAEFIAINKAGFEKGVRILHFLGGCSIELKGERAIVQTKMTISQRAVVEGVLCDVVCTGRFFDFVERLDDRWVVNVRQPIYEKDRLDAVTPGNAPNLNPELLSQFPEGYRHLAYLQSHIGYTVKRDMPGLVGPEVEELYARGERWLAGGPAI